MFLLCFLVLCWFHSPRNRPQKVEKKKKPQPQDLWSVLLGRCRQGIRWWIQPASSSGKREWAWLSVLSLQAETNRKDGKISCYPQPRYRGHGGGSAGSLSHPATCSGFTCDFQELWPILSQAPSRAHLGLCMPHCPWGLNRLIDVISRSRVVGSISDFPLSPSLLLFYLRHLALHDLAFLKEFRQINGVIYKNFHCYSPLSKASLWQIYFSCDLCSQLWLYQKISARRAARSAVDRCTSST